MSEESVEDQYMPCTGLDAVAADLCLKIEQAGKKYDRPFMDVMNRIMQIHSAWIDPAPKKGWNK